MSEGYPLYMKLMATVRWAETVLVIENTQFLRQVIYSTSDLSLPSVKWKL